ncbi:hypothetical protein NYE33_21940 [Paenibacillus sp. FSL R10-2199]|uniref:hypothetical protein n=1 Tax=Paenibacillus sp. FSL R10-2199 TaxID=2975348 RepID=UPI0030FCA1F2
MYELGIRQAFDLPVVLIKDDLTSRVFDTQHLRDVPYEHTLRIDAVTNAVSKLANALNDTEKHKDDSDSRSLISLLGIKAAKVPEKHEVSMETSIILDEIKSLKLQVNNSSLSIRKSLPKDPEQKTLFLDPNLLNALVMDDRLSGRKIEHNLYGKGIIITYDQDKMVIEFQSFGKMVFDADDFHGLRLLNEKE